MYLEARRVSEIPGQVNSLTDNSCNILENPGLKCFSAGLFSREMSRKRSYPIKRA